MFWGNIFALKPGDRPAIALPQSVVVRSYLAVICDGRRALCLYRGMRRVARSTAISPTSLLRRSWGRDEDRYR